MRKRYSRIIAAILCLVLVFAAVPSALAADGENSLGLLAESAILTDAETGKVLYEYNADDHHAPASVTKIMTLLLIVEALDRGEFTLDDTVTASAEAASLGGSQIYLKEGETFTVRDMIKAIAIASANDAAYAMSEFVAGSGDAFVRRMNERARELGMTNTNFVNVHGLDEDGHYTSARDIALMSRELMKHKMIFDYTTVRIDSLRDGAFTLTSTNKLLKSYNGITGLKTGSTSKALYSMSATARRDGVSLIAVVMTSPTGDDRFKDAARLLDYGFEHYARFGVSKEEKTFEPMSVIGGKKDDVILTLERDQGVLVKKEDLERISGRAILPETIKAPVNAGARVGNLLYTLDGEVIADIPIIAAESVERLDVGYCLTLLLKSLFASS
ncbi:MAG: D-alanyl-D-alanine carboxypeptidase [Clostridia bacterium]|nr:D-alanyl-D-alanine carboxypeptidase [Clostridia bacterium]